MIGRNLKKEKGNVSTQIPPWDVPRGLGDGCNWWEILEPLPDSGEHVPKGPVCMEVKPPGVPGLVF